jgi:glutamate N-acetyltransferase/amino-acid N-acetyltransferase
MGIDLRVKGFVGGAVRSGIRGKDRLDIGLIVSETPATAAGVFTTSLVKAAPVLFDMKLLAAKSEARAILVNSGIANACTGEQGFKAATATARLVKNTLGIDADQVLVCSTGVIGMQLDLANFEGSMTRLVQGLSPDGIKEVSQAMLTTDSFPKTAVRTLTVGGEPVKLVGIAKGAGMIMPNMATMLCFVMTDAAVTPGILQTILNQAVAGSFNSISVDGDTSTNDTVLILANGQAVNTPLDEGDVEGCTAFAAALSDLLKELALMIVQDGEGATKLVTIRVKGGRDAVEARRAAVTVANSSLVKTAFFGEDANWGRIIAALGRSGAQFDPYQVDIAFDEALMVRDGIGLGPDAEALATQVLKKKKFTVNIDLKAGTSACEVYTSDLTVDYVKINANYRT